MSAAEVDTASPPPRRAKRSRWQAWLLGLIALVLAGAGVALWWIDTPTGHRFITARIATIKPASGLRVSVGTIEGSIWSKMVLRDVRLGDPKGTVMRVPVAYLDWFPFGWVSNRLDIDRLVIPTARLDRMPKLRPSGKDRPILPGFDIRLADLRVGRLDLGAGVAGRPYSVGMRGRIDIRGGRAILALDARALDGGDQLRLSLDSRPDDNRFDAAALAIAPKGGVLAALTGFKRPFIGRITGQGDYALWRGQALLAIAGERASRVAIEQRAGQYRVAGTIETSAIGTGGLLGRMTAPRVVVQAHGAMTNRIVAGRATLASTALAVTASGGVDLGRSRFDALLLDVSLRQGSRLLGNMASEGLVLRARLSGPFETAAYEYLVRARTLDLGKVRLTGLRAEGRGRLDLAGTSVIPVDLRAERVRSTSAIASDLLQSVRIKGVAQLRNGVLTTSPVRIRTAKLDGTLLVVSDFGRGTWSVGFTGDIRGLEIRRFGRIDLASRINAGNGAGGGIVVAGRARAAMLRLDNAFLRGLGGGLPMVTSDLALGPDGRVLFRNLRLSAPDIQLSAAGYRSPDDRFHFEAKGAHRTYGPLEFALDGKIDRPRVDVRLASPLKSLGLADVHAVLAPTVQGYDFVAAGGSTLGPFTANGLILLPMDRPAVIRVAALNAGGAVASGTVLPQGSGLVGPLQVSGPVNGTIRFAIVEGVQQVGISLALDRARFAGPPLLAIGQGQVNGTVLLKPGATTIDGNVQGRGLRYGGLRLGRFTASASIINGTGAVTASANGPRGRQFTLLTRATIAPARIELIAGGTLDRVAFGISRAAVFTQGKDGWRLAPATLSYRGGSFTLAGLFGGSSTEAEASINRLPLALFDVFNPDLGLGGLANGTIRYSQPRGGPPSGAMQLRVRGLTRSGLALSSKPVDIGVNGELTAERMAFRAVAASGGQVVGRAQALIGPLRAGGLAERLTAAPMRAQIRYAGNADTLWRLSNIELFALSGDATLSADVAGTLDDPRISGTVATTNASLQSPVTGMTLTNLATSGTFDGATLTFAQISARTRGGGSLAGNGRFTFSSDRGIGIALSAQLDRALVLDRDDIGATASGPIRITSDGDGGLIAGDLTVASSRFTLGQAAAVAAIPQLRLIEVNRRGREIEAPRTASPWRMEIKAQVPNRLSVTGLGMQSEWSADLAIGGTVVAPQITGTASLIRGDYDFAGKRFELRDGRLRFSGETPINPTLAITATADVSNVSATINVSGTSAKPIINFTSIPALPNDELLSRILFGTSITNLSAPEALQLASAVAAFQGGGGGLDPINAVRRATGLSRLRILPADTTTGQRTSIAAGKHIGRSVYVELITDGQGYSATQVEYQITRWLSVLSSVSTIGRQSANLRATKDY